MAGNIQAHETLQMLIAYPVRQYADFDDEGGDKKAKKGKAAPPKAKNKKKKDAPFNYPAWAERLEDCIATRDRMEELAKDRENLKLDDEFME